MNRKAVFTLLLANALLCLEVRAEQKEFVAKPAGDWNNGENWAPPGIPAENDEVFIRDAEVFVNAPVVVAGITVEGKGKAASLKVLSFGEITTGIVRIGSSSKDAPSIVRVYELGILKAERIELAPGHGTANLYVLKGKINLKDGKGEIVRSGGQGQATIHFEGVGSLGLAKCEATDLAIVGSTDGAESALEILPGQSFTVERISIAPWAKSGEGTQGRLVISGGEVTVGHLKFNDGPAGVLSTAILQLNDGTLKASKISRRNDGADQIFEWNGGTLATREGEGADLSKMFLSAAKDEQKPLQIRLGDGGKQNFEVNGVSATIAPTAILTDKDSVNGTMVKSGDGILEIQSKCTYTGLTSVKAGLLLLSGSGSINGSAGVVVKRGAEFESNSSEPIPNAPGWLKKSP